jgi:arsenical pump membrane protein
MLIALLIFFVTVALVMVRPRPFNEATAAALGALVMISAGIVTAPDVWDVLKANINVLLFFLGLMVVSIVADKAGFFEWCAFKAVKMAHGKGPALLSVVFGLGALLTAFFSNDATALILTPIVYTLVTRLKLNPLPYVFACAFIANTASMLLPVSNPVNLLAVQKFSLTLGEYFKFLLIPSILVITINWSLFGVIFRRQIATSSDAGNNLETVKVDSFFLLVCGGLGVTALGYVLVSIYGLPLSYPAVGGAVILLAIGFGFRRIKLQSVAFGISWYIFLFIFSMALLVRGLENEGVINFLTTELSKIIAGSPLQALFAVTMGTAIGSNLINNWSMMMVSVSSLAGLANQAPAGHVLAYGAILGADLGPNIAILGSLSSMLWLMLLRKRGLDIHPKQYLKLGLIVAPPLLIIGTLALYACSRLWG